MPIKGGRLSTWRQAVALYRGPLEGCTRNWVFPGALCARNAEVSEGHCKSSVIRSWTLGHRDSAVSYFQRDGGGSVVRRQQRGGVGCGALSSVLKVTNAAPPSTGILSRSLAAITKAICPRRGQERALQAGQIPIISRARWWALTQWSQWEVCLQSCAKHLPHP